MAALTERWRQVAAHFDWPESLATEVRDELFARYQEPHRHYHSLEHVHSVLVALDELVAPGSPSAAARLAVWFHDAIYDGVAGDDEEASARLAEDRLSALGTPPEVTDSVASLVRATAGHATAQDDIEPESDMALMLDADLSILAAADPDYDRYVEQVRAEYAHVPPDRFDLGRRAVLAGLLARERLYLSAAGARRFEARARQNLARELASLPNPSGSV